MIELTIKTLDAQNHHFTVPDDYTVEQLKEHIAEAIQIPSDSQRCIYLGQVLQNETKLSDCDVNGKVIHVVQRPPPSSAYASNTQGSNTDSPPSTNRRPDMHTGTMYLGAMAFPSDFMETGGLTFLHSRTNLSVNRLVVARNLLRRAITVINSLENGNYFGSSSEQAQSATNQAANPLAEDINTAETNGGLADPPEVEIRIEIPNSQHDAVPEAMVGTDDATESSENIGIGSSEPTEQSQAEEATATGSGSNAQPETDNTNAGNNTRDEANRRRSRTPMMATVMGAVLHTQIRLIPFMRLLRQYLLQDTAFGPDANTTHTEQQVQSLYNSVSEIMHYFAHIYHMLSDIMCDFSQPPPRTLRCRSVVVQQQHASLSRGGTRARSTVIRSPLLAVRTNPPSTSATSGEPGAANATETPESANVEADNLNADAGTSSVEVVIEEADTTNIQDNNDESMDTSEPIIPGAEVRGRSGNTYVIQSMPDGIVPEAIRINSLEAILTPNEEIASALSSGTNQRWRDGALPTEVIQNMFGFVRQLRSAHIASRNGSGASGERSRSQSAQNTPSAQSASQGTQNTTQSVPNTSQGGQPSQNTDAGQADGNQNGPNERYVEIDVPGLSRTFDPFLPCHSHHIHPMISRAGSVRHITNIRSSSIQASSAQSEPTQAAPAQPTEPAQQSAQGSQTGQEQSADAQGEPRRTEYEGAFAMPDPRHVMSVINSLFPVFGNVMIRRNNTATNTATENTDANAQERSSSRARFQVTSGMSNFPGAIHIEIDPVMNNIQTNVVPNAAPESSSSSTRSRRTRTACRRPRAYAMSVNRNEPPDAVSAEAAFMASFDGTGRWPASSSSSSSSSSNSSDVDLPEARHEEKKAKKEKHPEYAACRTIQDMYSSVKKEAIRYLLLGSQKSRTPRNEVTNNAYPLFSENQEAVFFDIIRAVVNNTSIDEIIRGGNLDQLTSCVRRKIRDQLVQRDMRGCDKESLLNAVNILINNDLFKMKYLLDSESVKQEIDLVSTLCKFNHDSVPELIEFAVKSEDLSKPDRTEFSQLFNFYVARLLTLFVYCIAGDDKSVHIKKVLGSVVEEVIKGLPAEEELIRWLRKDLINHVISYSKICHPDNLPSFMRHYVVYRLPPVMPIECTVATATITSFGTNDQQNNEQSQPMEVEDAAQSSSSTSSEASFVSFNSEDATQAVPEQSNNNEAGNGDSTSVPVATTADAAQSSAESLPEVVLNSEEWHRSFPSEWVPIIARDIHRLRRQGSQPPFSDAYLSGMPTKRRKLIKNNKPDLNNTNQLITDNISTAIDSAGLSSSISAITNHVAESTGESSLSEIVKEELKENVRENIIQQTDFSPRRFPDSAKYFMDK